MGGTPKVTTDSRPGLEVLVLGPFGTDRASHSRLKYHRGSASSGLISGGAHRGLIVRRGEPYGLNLCRS